MLPPSSSLFGTTTTNNNDELPLSIATAVKEHPTTSHGNKRLLAVFAVAACSLLVYAQQNWKLGEGRAMMELQQQELVKEKEEELHAKQHTLLKDEIKAYLEEQIQVRLQQHASEQSQQLQAIREQQAQALLSANMANNEKQEPATVPSVLSIPQGEAEALPSIREPEVAVSRGQYGGKGDKKHLGGFTTYDGHGVSPGTWKFMLSDLGVKSVLDVGCGKGISTLWFHLHGARTLCLEGSHDGVENTLLPDPANQVVEHDFSRGPYWPKLTYDAVWCVEFLEHIGKNFQYNYIQAFRKAALIFVSHSQWGGWHHVEVHDGGWWIDRMESFGFKYSERLTKLTREAAKQEKHQSASDRKNNVTDALMAPDGNSYNAQHIWLNMQVFINPAVAALPEHAHLLSAHGCYDERRDGIVNRECGKGSESTLPPDFYPLELTREQDLAWLNQVKAHIASIQNAAENVSA